MALPQLDPDDHVDVSTNGRVIVIAPVRKQKVAEPEAYEVAFWSTSEGDSCCDGIRLIQGDHPVRVPRHAVL